MAGERIRARTVAKCLRIGASSGRTSFRNLHQRDRKSLQAVGCAEAGYRFQLIEELRGRILNFHEDEVVYVSLGDGASSEGEFWEALNTACNLKLPVLFLVEDNGYAISVPVEVQTAGGDISKLVEGFPNLYLQKCDGTDLLESLAAMRRAARYCRERRGPSLIHAHVIRPYSHSHSDDERLYRLDRGTGH